VTIMTHRFHLAAVAVGVSLLSGHAVAAVPDPVPTSTMAPPHRFAAGPFLAGQLAGELGDVGVAASEFQRALSEDPGNPEIQQQAFLSALLAGRPEAVTLASTQLASGNAAAILVLAGADAQAGRWDQAVARFGSLPHEGATRILQPLLVAWAQYGGGHPDLALATLQPFTTQGAIRGVYALHAALIADLSERQPEARRLFALARTTYPALNLDLGRELASFSARSGDLDGARRTLEQMASPSPELMLALPGLQRAVAQRQIRNPLDGMAETYLALAATERGEDRTDFASTLLRLALDLRPDFAPAHLLAAEIQAQAGRTDAALAELDAIPAVDPLALMVDLRRANLLLNANRIGAALVVANRLVAQAPTRPEVFVLQGDVLRADKRPADAVLAFQRATELVGTPTAANWPLFYDLGIAQDEADQWPAAQASFQHALTLSPDQPQVLNYLGYAWTERGQDLAHAITMVRRAVAQDPDDGAFVDSLGWIELRQGNVAEAIRQLERACELDSEDATINGHLGDAYKAAGRLREAAFQWQRALTLNPEPKDAAHYREGLRALPSADVPPVGPPAGPPVGPAASPG